MNKLRNKIAAAVLLAVMAIMPAAVQAEDGARTPGNSQRTEQRENLERETEYNDVFRKDDAEETAEDWLPDIVEEREREEHGYIGRVKDEERNLNELVFRNADGSSTMRVYSHPVKYIAQDGSIRDISLLLEEQADGFRPKGHAVRTSFAHRLSAGIGLEYEDISITLIPEGDGTGELSSDGRKVGYEINSKTRIEYELTYAGYKEDIVVKEYTGQTEYRFLLRTELDICADEHGQYRLLDGSGRVRARIGEILIVTADERNNSWGELKCEQTMPGEYLLKVILDEEYLRDAKTAYPIRIDPTIEINYDSSGAGAIEDVTINQGRTYAGDSGSISVGRNADGKLSRALMRFPGLSLTGIAAQSITAASVEIRDLMCQDDEDFTIDCHIYSISAPIWSEAGSTSWSGVGNAYLGAKLDSHLVSYGKGNAGSHRYSFNIITAARAWANGTQLASRGLVFKASDSFEGQTGSGIKTWHKTFASYNRSSNRPSLSITYTDTPVSVSVFPTSSKVSVGGSITLVARVLPDSAEDKSVIWYSNNDSIVNVDRNTGVAVGIAPGTAVVTCKTVDGGVRATNSCIITVSPISISYQTMSDTTMYESELTRGRHFWFNYTPIETGIYTFESYGDTDTYGILHSGNTQLHTDDNSGDETNFKLSYRLIAGNEYKLLVKGSTNTVKGIFNVNVVKGWPEFEKPEIHSRADWGARAYITDRLVMRTRKPQRIVFHHSADKFNALDWDSVVNEIQRIQNFHIDDRGKCDIAYNFIIDPQGRIWQGAYIDDYQHGHAEGFFDDIGVLILGDFEPRVVNMWNSNVLNQQQKDAMIYLSKWLCGEYKLSVINLDGNIAPITTHREVSGGNTVCPGVNAALWVEADLRTLINNWRS